MQDSIVEAAGELLGGKTRYPEQFYADKHTEIKWKYISKINSRRNTKPDYYSSH